LVEADTGLLLIWHSIWWSQVKVGSDINDIIDMSADGRLEFWLVRARA